MPLKISDVLKATRIMVEHILQNLDVNEEIPIDDYWDVRPPERYENSGGDAPASVSGSLRKDSRVIKPIFDEGPAGKERALVQLSNLLRAIGDHPEWVIPQGVGRTLAVNVGCGTEGNLG